MNRGIIVTLLLFLFVILLLPSALVKGSLLEPREKKNLERGYDKDREEQHKRTQAYYVYDNPTTFVNIHVHYPLSKLCSDCNIHVVSSINSWEGFDYIETAEDYDTEGADEPPPRLTDQSKAIKVSDNEFVMSIPFTNKQVGVTQLLNMYYIPPNKPTETESRWLQTNCPSALSGGALVNGGKQMTFRISSLNNVTYDTYPFFCKSKGRLYEFEVSHELHRTETPNESLYKGKVQVYLPASYEENPTPRPTHVLLKTDPTPLHPQDEISLDFMHLQGVIPELIIVWVKNLFFVGNATSQADSVTTKGTSSTRSRVRSEIAEGGIGTKKPSESEGVTWYRHCPPAVSILVQNSTLSSNKRKNQNNNNNNNNNNNGGTTDNIKKERTSSSKYSTGSTTTTSKTSSPTYSPSSYSSSYNTTSGNSNTTTIVSPPLFAFCSISKARNESCPMSLVPMYAFLDFFLGGVLTKMENTLGVPIPTRDMLSVYGSLEGGVVACSLVYSNSSVFSKGYCSSPSFSSDGGDMFLNLVKKQTVSNPITIMMDGGGRESSERKNSLDSAYQALVSRTESFVLGKNLMLAKYSSSSDASFHSNLSKRLPIALSFLYGDKITLAYSDRGTVLRYADIYRPFSFGVTFEIPSMMAYQLDGATESKALQ